MKFPPNGLRGQALREATPDYKRIIDLVRGAVDAKLNAGPAESRKWYDVDAVYADSVVVCLDGRHWRYPHCVMSARIPKSPAQCDKT